MKIFLIFILFFNNIILANENTIYNNKYNDNTNLILISSLLHSACDKCAEKELLLIGSVLLNRAKNSSIENELYRKNQFYEVNSSRFYPSYKTLKIAKKLLLNGSIDTTIFYYVNIEDSTDKKFINSIKQKFKFKKKFHSFYKK